MFIRFRIPIALLAVVCWLPVRAVAVSGPQETVQLPSTFRPLIQRSGYIFAGTVLAVEHVPPLPNEMPIVRVVFHIDEAIRGVQQGQTLTIREWAGSWNSSQQYRRGERVLLFLYPPSKLGLTSLVTGNSGQLELNARGEILLNHNQALIRRDESRNSAGKRNRIPRAAFLEALRRAAQE